MDFTDSILTPLTNILIEQERSGLNVRLLLGKSKALRLVMHSGYNSIVDDIQLEKMNQEEKINLWNASSEICINDRLNWCKAVRFYESVTN